MSLRRADHSSRGVLPTVVCLSVNINPRQLGGFGLVGAVVSWLKKSITDFIKEEVLLRVKEQRNILHEIRKRKANCIGHILPRNCLLQRVIERKIQGGIEVTGRQGRRRTKLLDDLKQRTGYSHLKEEALVRTMWSARFGRGYGPVVRQTTK